MNCEITTKFSLNEGRQCKGRQGERGREKGEKGREKGERSKKRKKGREKGKRKKGERREGKGEIRRGREKGVGDGRNVPPCPPPLKYMLVLANIFLMNNGVLMTKEDCSRKGFKKQMSVKSYHKNYDMIMINHSS